MRLLEKSETGGAIALDAAFDRPLLMNAADALRFMVVTLKGSTPKVDKTKPRTPLNLALVIDASGSMSGPPLAAAKHATTEIARRLQPEDRLSVVSFADNVVVHVDAVAADEHGREQTARAIEAIHTRGCTNLAAGWMSGARCVAAYSARNPGRQDQVIVLSDGMANRGERDPAQLQRHATELRSRGLATSCVGIGEKYSSAHLEAIATGGGGRLHHATSPEQIIEVVLGELDDVQHTVATNVIVEVELCDDVNIEVTGVDEVSREGNTLTIPVGTMVADIPRSVVVAVVPSARPKGAHVAFRVRALWSEPGQEGSHNPLVTDWATVSATVVGAGDPLLGRIDPQLGLAAAQAWQADAVARVIRWNRENRLDASRQYLHAQIGPFREYAALVPAAQRLLEELEHLFARADRPMAEINRKEMATMMNKRHRGERDKRASASDSLQDW